MKGPKYFPKSRIIGKFAYGPRSLDTLGREGRVPPFMQTHRMSLLLVFAYE